MEVTFHAENNCFVLWNPFLQIGPFPREFYPCLNCLGTRIHGEDHVEAKELSNLLSIAPKDGIVEGARRERELLSLLY